VYDLNMLLVPETMQWRSAISNRLLLKRSLAEAKRICTISRGTAKRLRDLMGRETNAIIRPAVSADFRPRQQDEISDCLHRYGIQHSYLMALSTWEPRKNLAMLVEAFVRMKIEGLLPKHVLVLVGGRGWRDEKLVTVVRNATDSGVIALGHVPDEDLPALYSACDAFVFPSIYEGFGIPVLEARACGARVVATDIPELREAGGDDTIYVAPTPEGLCSGIVRALAQQNRKINVDTNAHTWEESAVAFARFLLDGETSDSSRIVSGLSGGADSSPYHKPSR
jgi:glycosyltransferase involved in cell wall biosynthesis